MPSIVKVDNYTLLNHGSFRGLYLIVLDRRDLQKVYSGWYDLMLADTPILMNNITVVQNTSCVNATTNNTNGTITVGGTNYTIPSPSNDTNVIGNQTIVVTVKTQVNYTTVCTTVINRTNTRNFT